VCLQENPSKAYPTWTLYRADAEEVVNWQADENLKHIRLWYKVEGRYPYKKSIIYFCLLSALKIYKNSFPW
jgi:hypothetical protein